MANIFKTTLKKDVIADIANGKREVRFPITKFWATRFANEYNLDKRTFIFKTFDSLELSSPSNKDTGGETYMFNFVRTFIDGDEFVIEFKDNCEEPQEICQINDDVQNVEIEDIVSNETDAEDIVETNDDEIEITVNEINEAESVETIVSLFEGVEENVMDDEKNEEIQVINETDVFESIKQWFDNTNILENFYASEDVIATKARQVIVRPNGVVLGSKKTLPVNNDVNVRIEFDMSNKVYFDPTFDISDFEDDIYKVLEEIIKNNFVFVWKEYTGIFIDKNGIYFGIKYSTRKSIGFKRRYNVQ